MRDFSLQYGYPGVFLISLIGASAIFFLIPYTVVIFTFGGVLSFDPLLIASAAGLGSPIGEFPGYFFGMGSRKAISERDKKKKNILVRVVNRYGPLVICIFALTLLPDDLPFIPLGVMHYSLVKAFVPALIGEFLMILIIAYGGRFSVQVIRDIFGVEGGDFISAVICVVLSIVLLVVVVVVMFKMDWEKYFIEKNKRDGGN